MTNRSGNPLRSEAWWNATLETSYGNVSRRNIIGEFADMHNSSMNDYTHMSDDELRSTYEAMGTRLMW